MKTEFKLIKAKKAHFEKLANLMANTLIKDPINRYFFDISDESAIAELKKAGLFLLKFSNRYGNIWTTENLKLVCMVLPPGYPPIKMIHLLRFNHLPGLAHFKKNSLKKTTLVQKATRELETLKKQLGNHWYIQTLCIDISQQGKGFGSRVLEEITATLHNEKQAPFPILLETTNPDNIPFYQKNQFRVLATATIQENLWQYLLVHNSEATNMEG